MRRGQAALEFLTTYGWAFLVILVMIGALAYFGVLNPNRALPNKCLVTAGFDCREFIIDSDSFNISLVNKQGQGIDDVNLTSVTSDATTVDAATDCSISNSTVGVDKQFNIDCGVDLSASQGDKVKFEFVVEYVPSRGTYTQQFSGEIFGQVQ